MRNFVLIAAILLAGCTPLKAGKHMAPKASVKSERAAPEGKDLSEGGGEGPSWGHDPWHDFNA